MENTSEEMDPFKTIYKVYSEYNDRNKTDKITQISQELSSIVHNHWKNFQPISYGWQITIGIIVTVLGLAAFVGNILVISLFIRYKTFRKPSYFLVFNLAISDIAAATIDSPLLVISSFNGYWVFGVSGCKIYSFCTALFSFVSINTLTAIALERYIVIVYRSPWFRNTSIKSIKVTVCVIWIYSLAWALCPLLGWGNYILEGSLSSCTYDFFTKTRHNISFVISLSVFCFYIQLVLISVSYINIFCKVLSHGSYIRRLNEEMDLTSKIKHKKRKNLELETAKASLCIIIFFCGSWLPYAVVCMIGMFGNAALIQPLVSTLPGICAKIATILNPTIYALLHPKFRNKLASFCFKGNSELITNTSYSRTIQCDNENETPVRLAYLNRKTVTTTCSLNGSIVDSDATT